MIEAAVQPPLDPASVRQAISSRTAEVDRLVVASFAEELAKQSVGLALVAVGGYGRKELFPHSDVDLLFLVASDAAIPPKPVLSAYLQKLWDSNIRPSHSVHTLQECAVEHDGNLEFTISLLDHRFLTGDEALYQQFVQKFVQFKSRRGPALAKQLAILAGDRRGKFQNTIYQLEPNIKETPGGLRDLQTTRWLYALDPHGNLPDLSAPFEFLAGIRWRLHEAGRRDQNALTFEMQDALSDQPDLLMRDYFRHTRVIDQAARHAIEATVERSGELLRRFHQWRSRLSTADYTVSRDRVLLRGKTPPEGLQVFEFCARHGLSLSSDAIERLQGFDPKADWKAWKHFLGLPHAGRGLRAMQESGVLGVAIPEWRHIECLVTRDYFHRYTVDEHTLVAVEALESIPDGRFLGLWNSIEDPALVRFALLMHDIGKGTGRDHSEVSLEVAHAVVSRLGAPRQDREAVEFLVREHLTLSGAMTSRDLRDPATIRAVADTISTVERLRMLTMLTFADISAVNPQAMSPWRIEQLWHTFAATNEEFTKELAGDRIEETAGDSSTRAQFLKGLPKRYLRTHTREEVEAHALLAAQLASRAVALEVEHVKGAYRLTLLAKDRPALFASVAGALSSFGLNIVKAEAFSNSAGVVVDTFTFTDPHQTLELNTSEVDRLRGVVRNVVEGRQDVRALLRGRPKPLIAARARITPRVMFRDDASDGATLVEIVAQDRPGLLHDLGDVLSSAGCNIEVVMIDTEGHKALDVFYVTQQGKKLSAPVQNELRERLLAACAGGK